MRKNWIDDNHSTSSGGRTPGRKKVPVVDPVLLTKTEGKDEKQNALPEQRESLQEMKLKLDLKDYLETIEPRRIDDVSKSAGNLQIDPLKQQQACRALTACRAP